MADPTGLVFIIILVAWLILVSRLPSKPRSVMHEKKDADVQTCPHCRNVVGMAVPDIISTQIGPKEICPHCKKKIKR